MDGISADLVNCHLPNVCCSKAGRPGMLRIHYGNSETCAHFQVAVLTLHVHQHIKPNSLAIATAMTVNLSFHELAAA